MNLCNAGSGNKKEVERLVHYSEIWNHLAGAIIKSKLNYARLDYQRQQSLNETKTTSDKVYQLASTEYETQRVLVTSLAEKLRLIGINPERLTESSISRRVAIHSPINGFVSKVHVNIGKYVQPSEISFRPPQPNQ